MFVRVRLGFLPFLVIAGAALASGASSTLYDVDPGETHAAIRDNQLVLENNMLSARWVLAGGAVSGGELIVHPIAHVSEKNVALSQNIFVLKFKDGTILRSSAMTVKDGPRVEKLDAQPGASRSALQSPGQQIVMRMEDSQGNLSITWRGILRNGANYLRQEISIHALHRASPIREVELFDFKAPDARVVGTVKGSPVTIGDVFFGFEHPLSGCAVKEGGVRCSIARELPLRADQTVTYSSVIGVSSTGQMRRAFLNYVESERPRPYRPFLHYNSWYDIGFNNPYDEAAALDVVHSFGRELVQKRGVKLDSFLFDDGWDDPHTLWSFGAGFPNGFAPIRAAAEEYGAEPGVWLSPWGGYDKAKLERLKYGRQNGLETNEGGFALSGPKYYARFREVTLKFIRDFGVNQFKIDGTGNVNSVLPGSEFDSDFQAAISLMSDWRSVSPSIFINLTTGTYPSPFWLQYADSIWRGSDDHSFAGVGTWRERWITFRDGATFHNVVQAGPLFPLNSLMLHGLIYARQAQNLGSDPGKDFANEVHSYFGSGTQLQEMYITHSLLSDEDWNTLAEAAKWSRNNADVLVDTHWIGGDPNKLEVYGWASWSPRAGIFTLRNPSDKPQTYSLDVAKAFELPPSAPRIFLARSPWRENKNKDSDSDKNKNNDAKLIRLVAGESYTISLKPFEVLNLEASPEH
ncbi:MAG TPA: enterotoxin [Terriglobales bacterium]|nr:enterotoxin [Terriglobales bacterium]